MRFSRRTLCCAPVAFWLASRDALADTPVRLQLVTAKISSLRDVSFGDLRQLYRGVPMSLAGQHCIPLNHPARTPDRVGFDRVVLGMGPDEVGAYWVDQKIRGGNAPPRTVENIGLLLRLVAKLPGAIGYVREGFSSDELKILTIEGRSPTDAGYPLVYR